MLHHINKKDLIERLKNVKLIAVDMDGTMTDGGMYLSDDNISIKKFYAHDGIGLKMISSAGVKIALITTSISPIATHRTDLLGIDKTIMGSYDKDQAINEISKEFNIDTKDMVYMGDDVNDIPAFQIVGVPIATNNCVQSILDFVIYKTEKDGGNGAVREICDLILLSKTGRLYGPPYVKNFP